MGLLVFDFLFPLSESYIYFPSFFFLLLFSFTFFFLKDISFFFLLCIVLLLPSMPSKVCYQKREKNYQGSAMVAQCLK